MAALRVLVALADPHIDSPRIMPRVKGGIQLEWHSETVDLEVYIDAADCISFFAEDSRSGESVELPLTGNQEVLAAWARRA